MAAGDAVSDALRSDADGLDTGSVLGRAEPRRDPDVSY
jgi:hypothetical protein